MNAYVNITYAVCTVFRLRILNLINVHEVILTVTVLRKKHKYFHHKTFIFI